MNAENELAPHTNKPSPPIWQSLWTGFWRVVVLGLTLACIYYLFALWGVILLVILVFRQVRKVLHWEAQRKR
jgi:uncharacterized membrane protein YoaK (UPF0700 family)